MMELKLRMNCRHDLLLLVLLLTFLLIAGNVAAKDVADIYQQAVPEMTTLECAKCHLQAFEALRDVGGLHQQQCRDCHVKFHTFTPGVAWEDRVPSCSSCHESPHGETMNNCLECHRNAHAPIDSLVAAEILGERCHLCHQSQVDDLGQEGNVHGTQACVGCHQGERHGESPQCQFCHGDSHTEYVDNKSCTVCHPAHAPSPVRYDNKVPNVLCGGCHVDQLNIQQASDKKHKSLACVICHAAEHGKIMDCQLCHKNGPHNQALLENFSSCSDCHGDAHQLKL